MPAQTPLRFIFPHAPKRAITINGNMQMRGWYDLLSMDFTHRQDRVGIEQSATILRRLIAQENQRGIACENIFLGGFSQGGALALHTGVRFAQRVAGLIILSAYLPLAESLAAEKTAANQHTPIFMAHGNHDPLIPIQLARAGKQQLTSCGYSVAWREYPIQHNVSTEQIADLADFLRAHLSA